MNIKKILAAASASVVAVSAMAVTSLTSFAETEKIDVNLSISGSGDMEKTNQEGETITVSGGMAETGSITLGEYLEDYDLSTVTIEVELECDTGYANGAFGGSVGSNWQSEQWELSGTSDTVSWTPDGGMSLESLQMQFWWINPNLVYDEKAEEPKPVIEDNGYGTLTVKSITIDGEKKQNEDDTSGDNTSGDDTSDDNNSKDDTSSKPEESKPEESKPEESKPEESKPVVDNTPKIKPSHEQSVPAIGEGPADQRPVPEIQYNGTKGDNGNSGNTSNGGDSTSKPTDPSNPSNPSTGVAIAFAPALLAGAAVVVAKKRK